ncbi:MAG: putative bacteriophage related protein [Phycisphaerales bacterium]|nr:putative bacteriophage related protein [Phycisphaerales bacterium]
MKAALTESIEQTLAALERMTVTQLRAQYLSVFGEATRASNRHFLFKRLAWRIQSLAEGGLSERAKRRAAELARDADIRMTVPRPPKAGEATATRTVAMPAPKLTAHDRLPIAGTVLTRMYRGKQVETKVLPRGFEYEGQVYRSLTAVAKAVTGSHWNGHLFFGLTGAGRNPQ